MSENEIFDVVVIGGGVAGLSGALALGRSRRRVLVVDAGEPRNAPAGHAHNYLGREGIPPLELLRIGRDEVKQYDVEVAADRVVDVVRGDGGFVVSMESGREVIARRVLVTAGVADRLPAVPGLGERWGRDVLHCPYCHGWEVRDQAIAVLASTPMAAHHGLLFRQLSDDVVMVVLDGVELPSADLERLAAIGVRFEYGTPAEVVTEGDRLVGLRLADGSVLEREAIVVASVPVVEAAFLRSLAIEPTPVEMAGTMLGEVIAVDPMGATGVAGVYAAGNVTDVSMTLMAAAAHGNRVGALINAELAAEDADRAVEARRAELFERPSWERRYAGEQVWSGRVNPQLEREAQGLEPGRALDVGCGEGGDAIWLAGRGWQVTALDFADGALARTTAHAAEAGVGDRVTTARADLRTWEPGGEVWDLVSSQFVHLPDSGMVDLTRALASAVAPGGTLLVVGHHPDDHITGLRHGHHAFLFTAESLLPALGDDFEVEVCATRRRTQVHPHSGEKVVVNDAVLRARRRA